MTWFDFSDLLHSSLGWSVGVFSAAAFVIALAGWRLASDSDLLADRTGMGEALAGALFLGATTSLPGIITSATAAFDGLPELSLSNALGGIAAQTVFLAVADLCYRGANLEHAAASAPNVMQATLLITLLGVVLTATFSPAVTVWGVHPATLILLGGYVYGLRMVRDVRNDPMWKPKRTEETRTDEPGDESKGPSTRRLWIEFGALALTVGTAGYVVEKSAVAIAGQTALSQSIVGGMLTAIATSLPELVTSIAAVRRGALTMAVGGIIGGNAFDTLFVAVSDLCYRDGSIYHAATGNQMLMISVTIVMTGVLLMGLIRRERWGVWGIGFESFLIILLYLSTFGLLIFKS